MFEAVASPIDIEQPAGLCSPEGGWHAYHVFYPGDRDLLLAELVAPLLGRLVVAGVIDRFFFVRYDLGGPHVRLRWRSHRPEIAEHHLASACERFFERSPSEKAMPEAEIREINRGLLADDPTALPEEDQVFPSQSWVSYPTRFEVDRYGGELRFPAALDAFCLSSIAAAELGERLRRIPPSRHRPQWLRLLAGLAWGLAADEEELDSLLGYGVRFMGEAFEACVTRADDLFERHADELTALLESELERAGRNHGSSLFEAGRQVAKTLRDTGADERWYTLASHLHMTANRLGIHNPEEVYLSRMLYRAGRRLRSTRSGRLQRLWRSRPAPHPDFSAFTTAAVESWAARGNHHEG